MYGIRPSSANPVATPAPHTSGALVPTPARDPRARIEQSRGPRAPVAPVRPNKPQAVSGALPLHAPPGTDPELWQVLSEDERAYFARLGAMGPLTYGRVLTQQPSAPIVRGGRLDVKV
jgi:hypothetical protein